jgi:hypothetical protein
MRFLGATLYQMSGADNRSDYARFCDRLYRPSVYMGMSEEQIKAVQVNRKWLELLDHGVQLQQECLQRLTQASPELAKLLDNDLWSVLSWDSNDHTGPAGFLDGLRPQCRALEGSRYEVRIHSRMRDALGIPDWTRLALPMAMLADLDIRSQRPWLNKHFCNYLALASLSSTYQGCFADLWVLINEWVTARKDMWIRLTRTQHFPFQWVRNPETFALLRYRFEAGRDVMMERGWLPEADAPTKEDLAMLWCVYLGGKPLTDKLLNYLVHGARRAPRLLRNLMRALDPRLDVRTTNPSAKMV